MADGQTLRLRAAALAMLLRRKHRRAEPFDRRARFDLQLVIRAAEVDDGAGESAGRGIAAVAIDRQRRPLRPLRAVLRSADADRNIRRARPRQGNGLERLSRMNPIGRARRKLPSDRHREKEMEHGRILS